MNGKVLNKEALKAWILSKIVTLTNNLLATEPGVSAMDAAQGPVIQGQIDKINSNLGGIRFGITEDGHPGWKDGADAVHPFSCNRAFTMLVTGKLRGYLDASHDTTKTFSITINVDEDGNYTTSPGSAAVSGFGYIASKYYISITKISIEYA